VNNIIHQSSFIIILTSKDIIKLLPYSEPFLFVDELSDISENGVVGSYTFKADSFFYKGHFKGFPITPGVILTETMAQIGVVCLGIFLLKDKLSSSKMPQIALTSNEVDFLKPVFPKEKVTVISEKIYFRFGKLKCKVKMKNSKGIVVCRGTISGMIKRAADEK
jgi:3-hydroxyacyl-[acyl-carrier-protein] dehydratase